ncbi:O-methyltransferase [Brevibacillus fluminis]|uniref:tRNA 5-hydroxyuridine methyltransferase n=1 Tax=Brevibacillus fluminis TaxID=511487 RepID=A0A3M8DT23_9BACL|nr:O-methyltransferase [Brevibacillus fluminis]RNB90649.1 O-methyltransferase [Brevibacillus fluminis]
MITAPQIEAYIASLIPARSPLLTRMEEEAHAEHIPIIQLPSAQLMRFFVMQHQPKSILEIGTAIGYSTIWLAEAAPDARIVTMEIDQERISRARQNFAEAGVTERIELLDQDATKGLPESYRFDCLFIDAAKGQYRTFLDLYVPHLNPGGLVISDNVLFRGQVADLESATPRQRPMVEKIDGFNRYLAAHPLLDTTFIPIGDGLAVSVLRK